MSDQDTTQQPAAPVIAMQPVKSSNLEAVGYDEASTTLAVQFKNGTTYHYPGVPLDKFQQMLAAPSIGSFYSTEIRGKFEGSRQ